ncbi:unnamed protein product [Adineta ricciae]|uniref:Uncharacterized protein n=1 Tax=Adineta ricciae TaxID=249248 RepID=A0A814J4C1_ADIRI|nr:unnamed protein product [Adineta ricciae]
MTSTSSITKPDSGNTKADLLLHTSVPHTATHELSTIKNQESNHYWYYFLDKEIIRCKHASNTVRHRTRLDASDIILNTIHSSAR